MTPFTIKGMRSAAEMSRLQPEMKKLQEQYKNDRIKQNEEIQALYKEHGVNPLGGCLPTLLPLPIFFIIFRLLRGLNARHNGVMAPLVRVLRHDIGGPGGYVAPHYLSYKTTMFQHLIGSNGVLKSFGVDLGLTARDHHASVGAAVPYFALIVVMTGSQYWQTRQINQRNPAAAQANPQMKLTMQLFPAFYAVISLSIPASVVFYLLMSGLYRMAQNSISYRFDPVLARAAAQPTDVIEASAKETKIGSPAKAALTSGQKPRVRAEAASSRPSGQLPEPARAAGSHRRRPPPSPASPGASDGPVVIQGGDGGAAPTLRKASSPRCGKPTRPQAKDQRGSGAATSSP